MTARKGTEKTTPLAAQLVQIDRICDEFEARWRTGERPEIEEYLVRARFADRGKLLADLLEIELEMRAAGSEEFVVAEYRNRFVDYLSERRSGLRVESSAVAASGITNCSKNSAAGGWESSIAGDTFCSARSSP